MEATFNQEESNLFGRTVFSKEFNHFEQINATQAWSLLFTVERLDEGLKPKVGIFLTSLLFAVGASGIIRVLIFQNS